MYAVALFPNAQSLGTVAESIVALLHPSIGVDQEFYLNTRHFQH